MEDDDLDVRVEIKVAMFWRGLIGDGEYGKFNPKDMFRWYQALELLGPEDVRDLYRRRQSNRPMPIVQGLDRAPHPPAWLVETWLDKHETKIRTGSLWLGMGAFTSIWFLFGTYMNGCQNMHQSTAGRYTGGQEPAAAVGRTDHVPDPGQPQHHFRHSGPALAARVHDTHQPATGSRAADRLQPAATLGGTTIFIAKSVGISVHRYKPCPALADRPAPSPNSICQL
jgi:hypothetical protein